MTITRSEVAALNVGDTVRVTQWYGLTVEGALSSSNINDSLWLGQHILVRDGNDGNPGRMIGNPENTLTVISRAPRLLYVNHPRTQPVHGDIVWDKEGDAWQYTNKWWVAGSLEYGQEALDKYKPLTLLVDGETGEVVK